MKVRILFVRERREERAWRRFHRALANALSHGRSLYISSSDEAYQLAARARDAAFHRWQDERRYTAETGGRP